MMKNKKLEYETPDVELLPLGLASVVCASYGVNDLSEEDAEFEWV